MLRFRAVLFGGLVALSWTLPAVANSDWPFWVADQGCRFEWEGPRGYRETAFSHGVGEFPLIRFSRTDWGPRVHPFIPFCGEICTTPEGRASMRAIFPLKVGNSSEFDVFGSHVRLSVLEKVEIEHLDNLVAFVVKGEVSGEHDTLSWWAPSVGWLVGFEVGDFAKTVVEIDCPDGFKLPALVS